MPTSTPALPDPTLPNPTLPDPGHPDPIHPDLGHPDPAGIGARRGLAHPPTGAAALVLDTNVVLDWFVFGNPHLAALTAAIRSGRLRWLCCAAMQAELAHVLNCGRLSQRGLNAEQVLTSAARWQTAITLPEGLPLPRLRCRDASDQMFLDLALHGGARWLITRDRALLSLARKAAALGLDIVVPERWHEVRTG